MDHPFYDPEDPEQLANASFSILKSSSPDAETGSIEWEVLIDAGHGVVQYLVRHGNRLPEAVVLTHSHLDHTLSLDWILQSYYRFHKKEKRLPLYASRPGWDFVAASFPQLPPLTDYREIRPGETGAVEGIPELLLTPLPVYHGEKVTGASMLVFELDLPGRERRKILFTGDLLCPLLRKADYRFIRNADLAVLDANNRFPYTGSNHWSISPDNPDGSTESKYLKAWKQQMSCTGMIATHLHAPPDPEKHRYFDEFLAYCNENMPLSVFEFCHRISPAKAMLVHYSGMEDRNYYNEEILNPVQLENWANAEAERREIGTGFRVPRPGELFELA
jgi:phosphoribosyl 1,2-cyclic phosphodiesterase